MKPIYNNHTHSYLSLRKSVGIIGILFPFVLYMITYIISNQGVQPSISHYYHTHAGDVFVGALCAISLFMFFYTGYSRADNWAGNLAGLFALGVAWFPTPEVGDVTDWVGRIHFISALLLFLTLSYFCLFLFTKSGSTKEERSRNKRIRNGIYIACGVIMLLCLVFLAYVFLNDLDDTSSFPYVYTGETIALVAFGASWLIKGEFMFKG